jgi:hypothetical protein
MFYHFENIYCKGEKAGKKQDHESIQNVSIDNFDTSVLKLIGSQRKLMPPGTKLKIQYQLGVTPNQHTVTAQVVII